MTLENLRNRVTAGYPSSLGFTLQGAHNVIYDRLYTLKNYGDLQLVNEYAAFRQCLSDIFESQLIIGYIGILNIMSLYGADKSGLFSDNNQILHTMQIVNALMTAVYLYSSLFTYGYLKLDERASSSYFIHNVEEGKLPYSRRRASDNLAQVLPKRLRAYLLQYKSVELPPLDPEYMVTSDKQNQQVPLPDCRRKA